MAERHPGTYPLDVGASNQEDGVTERRISDGQPLSDVKERLSNPRKRPPTVRHPHIDRSALEIVVKALDWSTGPRGVNAAWRRSELR